MSQARLRSDLDTLVGDLPGPGAIVTSATDRVELRGVMGSLKRQGEWTVPTRLALYRRMGSVELDLTGARFAGPMVVIELDMKFGGLDLRLPDGASASIDDVEVVVGSAHDHRKDAPAEGTPHVILTGKVVCGSVDIRGPRKSLVRPRSPLLTRLFWRHACSHRTSPRRGVADPSGAQVDRPPRVRGQGRRRKEGTEPWVQTPEVIEKMRVAGRIAAGALAEAGKAVAPGVTTDELDRIAHEYMVDHGAYPSTLGYKGYPKSCCTSLNEVICHGIPDSTVVEDGDIVNIDVTAYIDGVHGDTNATFLAGDVSEEHRLLVERTHEATMRAIKAVEPGRALSVVGRVIESYANRFGYNVVRDFTGHGIGTTFHNGLVVLHYDQPAVETVIEPGMTFTIEPMINLGALDYEIWDDDWTVVNTDRKWTAQFEHTLVVTDDGAEILTQL